MLPRAFYLAVVLGLDLAPTQPLRPDFYALVPPARIWTCPKQDWFGYAERRCEAHLLARYLTRCWSLDTLAGRGTGDAGEALSLLAVLQQFDSSLWVLDPNPTVADAVARIRTYRPVFALACEQFRNGPDEKPKPGHFSTRQHFYRFRELMRARYGPLFARTG